MAYPNKTCRLNMLRYNEQSVSMFCAVPLKSPLHEFLWIYFNFILTIHRSSFRASPFCSHEIGRSTGQPERYSDTVTHLKQNSDNLNTKYILKICIFHLY